MFINCGYFCNNILCVGILLDRVRKVGKVESSEIPTIRDSQGMAENPVPESSAYFLPMRQVIKKKARR